MAHSLCGLLAGKRQPCQSLRPENAFQMMRMKNTPDTYARLVTALLLHPKSDARSPVAWPRSKTLRVSSTHRRPSESEWVRRLTLS